MADGELKLKLDDDTARRLQAAAAAGLPVADYAAELISDGLAAPDPRWREAYAALEEYDRTGEGVSLEEALAEFRTALDERLAQGR
jgi:hypothetical protein